MITINVDSSKKTISGSHLEGTYNIPLDVDKLEKLRVLAKKFEEVETMEEAQSINAQVIELTQYNPTEHLSSVHPDLYVDGNGEHFLRIGDKAVGIAMPKALTDKIKYALDNGVSIDPIINFWKRLLRNPNVTSKNGSARVTRLVNYITKTTQDQSLYEAAIEKGYSHTKAQEFAEVQNVPLSEEGVLLVNKVVDVVNHKFEIDEEGNVKKVDTRESTFDEETGKVTYIDPEIAEDFVFEPCVINRDLFENEPNQYGYYINGVSELKWRFGVGDVVTLPTWDRVNCNPRETCVPGLHIGGVDYIKGYEHKGNVTLDCFVDPMYIGTVAGDDQVLRVKEYKVVGIKNRTKQNKYFYHPSRYAAQGDNAWNTSVKAELLQKYADKIKEIQENADMLNSL